MIMIIEIISAGHFLLFGECHAQKSSGHYAYVSADFGA